MRSAASQLAPSLVLVVVLASCGGAPAQRDASGGQPTPGGSAPARVPMAQAPPGFWDDWGDGRAELAGYRLTQPRYGELRHGEAVLITVTEDFTAGQRVKSDGGHGDEYPVLKLNEVRDFQTGIYDYNVMTSSFVRIDGRIPLGLPDKLTFSMQEWCGHVFEELSVTGAQLTRTLSSYFDGESAPTSVSPAPPGGVVADLMPLLVRDLVGVLLAPGETRSVPWLPSAGGRRMAHRPFGWGTATLARSVASESVEVPAGRFDAYTVTAVTDDGVSAVWTVEAAAPRRLLRWSRSDGEEAVLTGVSRRAYWNEHGEGQEALRAELGLPQRDDGLTQRGDGLTERGDGLTQRDGGAGDGTEPTLPTLARIAEPRLNEGSGLERSRRHPGVFWSLNDSGGEPELFALDRSGRSLGRVRVQGAQNVDWEDLTSDDAGHLYLHDGGNNLNLRRDLTVYRIPEPPSLQGEVTVDRVLRFAFPDQTAFPPAAKNFDSEALFWSDGRLFLLTKHRADSRTTLRRFPDLEGPPSGSSTAASVFSLPPLGEFELGGDPERFGGKVTAADVSPDGAWLAVLTYHAIFLFPRPERPEDWLRGTPKRIDLEQLVTQQDEAIAWDGEALIFTNEGGDLFRIANPHDPACRRFPTPGCR